MKNPVNVSLVTFVTRMIIALLAVLTNFELLRVCVHRKTILELDKSNTKANLITYLTAHPRRRNLATF